MCLSPYLRIRTGVDRWSLEDDGVIKEKSRIVFDLPSTRKILEDVGTPYDVIPCGQCDECLKKRVKDWSIRIINEASYHNENYFITLTYDNKYLPKNNSVDKESVKKFFKRLKDYVRNNIDKDLKFKYYCVAEYGDGKGERFFINPHYHFISFGLPLVIDGLTDIFPDGHPHFSQSGDRLFYSPMLSKLWPFGFVTVQDVTFGDAAYVAGYVHKKMKENKPVIHEEIAFFKAPDGRALAITVPVRYNPYELLDIEKPFTLMSKGIGERYVLEHMDTLFETDEIFYDSGQYGVKSSLPPRYYVKKLEQHNINKAKEIKDKRKFLATSTITVDNDNQYLYNKSVKLDLANAKKENRKRGLTSLS